MSITQEEFDTLKKAHEIWRRLQPEVSNFLIYSAKASGSWNMGTVDFIEGVAEDHIMFGTVSAHDDGEWDTNTTSVSLGDLLALDHVTAKHKAVFEAIEDVRRTKTEEEAKQRRREMLEALKKEFEGD